MIRRFAALALLLAGTAAGAQERQSDRSFTWEGTVPEGRWLYVRNLNGAIRVARASGNRIEVEGTKRWRRGDPDLVRIDLAGQGDAPQASGRALWSRQRGMVFSGTNLPPLPAGRVYQVWVLTDDPAPISAGLLAADGSGVFSTPPDIRPPAAVAVTIEAAPGTTAPTTNPFLIGKPAAS